jgi:DNA-binding NarL/FixJ family response regulator
MPVRIVVVDDHAILRQGLRALLEGKDYEVVGEAVDGASALSVVDKLQPDLVIMDIGLPGLSGIEVTQQLCARHPRLMVLALSMHTDHTRIIAMLQAGARAYLVKSGAFKELITAIEEVRRGRRYLSPQVASGVLNDLLDQTSPRGGSAYTVLTPQERRMVQWIAEGYGTKEIALRLGITTRTAEAHRTRIMEKLNLDSVVALTKYAIGQGLTTLEAYREDDT